MSAANRIKLISSSCICFFFYDLQIICWQFDRIDGDGDIQSLDDNLSWYSWTPHSGKEVPLADKSTEWAIFTCSAIEVRKFAFENETQAREALEDWSFANILTKDNEEVDVRGVILAPNIGRIRECIDSVRSSPLLLRATSDNSTSSAVSSLSSLSASVSEEIQSGSSSSSVIDMTGANPEGGSIENVHSDWGVWISEFFTVKRYGFDREVDAKCAMEQWMSVRILTFQEEEVEARGRWHTDAILAIRQAIRDKKRQK